MLKSLTATDSIFGLSENHKVKILNSLLQMLNAFDSIINHNMVYCGRGAASLNANGF